MHWSIFQFPHLCMGMWISLSKEFKEGIRCIPLYEPFIGYIMCLHLHTEITAFSELFMKLSTIFSFFALWRKSHREIMKRNYSSQLIRTAAPEPNTEGVACGNKTPLRGDSKSFFNANCKELSGLQNCSGHYLLCLAGDRCFQCQRIIPEKLGVAARKGLVPGAAQKNKLRPSK